MTISIPVIVVIAVIVAVVALRKKHVRCPECGDRMYRQTRPMAIAGTEQYLECEQGHVVDIPDRG